MERALSSKTWLFSHGNEQRFPLFRRQTKMRFSFAGMEEGSGNSGSGESDMDYLHSESQTHSMAFNPVKEHDGLKLRKQRVYVDGTIQLRGRLRSFISRRPNEKVVKVRTEIFSPETDSFKIVEEDIEKELMNTIDDSERKTGNVTEKSSSRIRESGIKDTNKEPNRSSVVQGKTEENMAREQMIDKTGVGFGAPEGQKKVTDNNNKVSQNKEHEIVGINTGVEAPSANETHRSNVQGKITGRKGKLEGGVHLSFERLDENDLQRKIDRDHEYKKIAQKAMVPEDIDAVLEQLDFTLNNRSADFTSDGGNQEGGGESFVKSLSNLNTSDTNGTVPLLNGNGEISNTSKGHEQTRLAQTTTKTSLKPQEVSEQYQYKYPLSEAGEIIIQKGNSSRSEKMKFHALQSHHSQSQPEDVTLLLPSSEEAQHVGQNTHTAHVDNGNNKRQHPGSDTDESTGFLNAVKTAFKNINKLDKGKGTKQVNGAEGLKAAGGSKAEKETSGSNKTTGRKTTKKGNAKNGQKLRLHGRKEAKGSLKRKKGTKSEQKEKEKVKGYTSGEKEKTIDSTSLGTNKTEENETQSVKEGLMSKNFNTSEVDKDKTSEKLAKNVKSYHNTPTENYKSYHQEKGFEPVNWGTSPTVGTKLGSAVKSILKGVNTESSTKFTKGSEKEAIMDHLDSLITNLRAQEYEHGPVNTKQEELVTMAMETDKYKFSGEEDGKVALVSKHLVQKENGTNEGNKNNQFNTAPSITKENITDILQQHEAPEGTSSPNYNMAMPTAESAMRGNYASSGDGNASSPEQNMQLEETPLTQKITLQGKKNQTESLKVKDYELGGSKDTDKLQQSSFDVENNKTFNELLPILMDGKIVATSKPINNEKNSEMAARLGAAEKQENQSQRQSEEKYSKAENTNRESHPEKQLPFLLHSKNLSAFQDMTNRTSSLSQQQLGEPAKEKPTEDSNALQSTRNVSVDIVEKTKPRFAEIHGKAMEFGTLTEPSSLNRENSSLPLFSNNTKLKKTPDYQKNQSSYVKKEKNRFQETGSDIKPFGELTEAHEIKGTSYNEAQQFSFNDDQTYSNATHIKEPNVSTKGEKSSQPANTKENNDHNNNNNTSISIGLSSDTGPGSNGTTVTTEQQNQSNNSSQTYFPPQMNEKIGLTGSANVKGDRPSLQSLTMYLYTNRGQDNKTMPTLSSSATDQSVTSEVFPSQTFSREEMNNKTNVQGSSVRNSKAKTAQLSPGTFSTRKVSSVKGPTKSSTGQSISSAVNEAKLDSTKAGRSKQKGDKLINDDPWIETAVYSKQSEKQKISSKQHSLLALLKTKDNHKSLLESGNHSTGFADVSSSAAPEPDPIRSPVAGVHQSLPTLSVINPSLSAGSRSPWIIDKKVQELAKDVKRKKLQSSDGSIVEVGVVVNKAVPQDEGIFSTSLSQPYQNNLPTGFGQLAMMSSTMNAGKNPPLGDVDKIDPLSQKIATLRTPISTQLPHQMEGLLPDESSSFLSCPVKCALQGCLADCPSYCCKDEALGFVNAIAKHSVCPPSCFEKCWPWCPKLCCDLNAYGNYNDKLKHMFGKGEKSLENTPKEAIKKEVYPMKSAIQGGKQLLDCAMCNKLCDASCPIKCCHLDTANKRAGKVASTKQNKPSLPVLHSPVLPVHETGKAYEHDTVSKASRRGSLVARFLASEDIESDQQPYRKSSQNITPKHMPRKVEREKLFKPHHKKEEYDKQRAVLSPASVIVDDALRRHGVFGERKRQRLKKVAKHSISKRSCECKTICKKSDIGDSSRCQTSCDGCPKLVKIIQSSKLDGRNRKQHIPSDLSLRSFEQKVLGKHMRTNKELSYDKGSIATRTFESNEGLYGNGRTEKYTRPYEEGSGKGFASLEYSPHSEAKETEIEGTVQHNSKKVRDKSEAKKKSNRELWEEDDDGYEGEKKASEAESRSDTYVGQSDISHEGKLSEHASIVRQSKINPPYSKETETESDFLRAETTKKHLVNSKQSREAWLKDGISQGSPRHEHTVKETTEYVDIDKYKTIPEISAEHFYTKPKTRRGQNKRRNEGQRRNLEMNKGDFYDKEKTSSVHPEYINDLQQRVVIVDGDLAQPTWRPQRVHFKLVKNIVGDDMPTSTPGKKHHLHKEAKESKALALKSEKQNEEKAPWKDGSKSQERQHHSKNIVEIGTPFLKEDKKAPAGALLISESKNKTVQAKLSSAINAKENATDGRSTFWKPEDFVMIDEDNDDPNIETEKESLLDYKAENRPKQASLDTLGAILDELDLNPENKSVKKNGVVVKKTPLDAGKKVASHAANLVRWEIEGEKQQKRNSTNSTNNFNTTKQPKEGMALNKGNKLFFTVHVHQKLSNGSLSVRGGLTKTAEDSKSFLQPAKTASNKIHQSVEDRDIGVETVVDKDRHDVSSGSSSQANNKTSMNITSQEHKKAKPKKKKSFGFKFLDANSESQDFIEEEHFSGGSRLAQKTNQESNAFKGEDDENGNIEYLVDAAGDQDGGGEEMSLYDMQRNSPRKGSASLTNEKEEVFEIVEPNNLISFHEGSDVRGGDWFESTHNAPDVTTQHDISLMKSLNKYYANRPMHRDQEKVLLTEELKQHKASAPKWPFEELDSELLNYRKGKNFNSLKDLRNHYLKQIQQQDGEYALMQVNDIAKALDSDNEGLRYTNLDDTSQSIFDNANEKADVIKQLREKGVTDFKHVLKNVAHVNLGDLSSEKQNVNDIIGPNLKTQSTQRTSKEHAETDQEYKLKRFPMNKETKLLISESEPEITEEGFMTDKAIAEEELALPENSPDKPRNHTKLSGSLKRKKLKETIALIDDVEHQLESMETSSHTPHLMNDSVEGVLRKKNAKVGPIMEEDSPSAAMHEQIGQMNMIKGIENQLAKNDHRLEETQPGDIVEEFVNAKGTRDPTAIQEQVATPDKNNRASQTLTLIHLQNEEANKAIDKVKDITKAGLKSILQKAYNKEKKLLMQDVGNKISTRDGFFEVKQDDEATNNVGDDVSPFQTFGNPFLYNPLPMGGMPAFPFRQAVIPFQNPMASLRPGLIPFQPPDFPLRGGLVALRRPALPFTSDSADDQEEDEDTLEPGEMLEPDDDSVHWRGVEDDAEREEDASEDEEVGGEDGLDGSRMFEDEEGFDEAENVGMVSDDDDKFSNDDDFLDASLEKRKMKEKSMPKRGKVNKVPKLLQKNSTAALKRP